MLESYSETGFIPDSADRAVNPQDDRVMEIIQASDLVGNVLVSPQHSLVVLRHDALTDKWSACGSEEDVDEARDIARQSIHDDARWHESSDIVCIFDRKNGIQIPLIDPSES